MKSKVLGLLAVGLLAGPMAAEATVIGDFGSSGRITLDLNANGTISASLQSFAANITGFGIDSTFNSTTATEGNFSPVNPSSGGNLGGWGTPEGSFNLGFFCNICSTAISWTIGSVGQFTSVYDILNGTGSLNYDFFLLTSRGGQSYAVARDGSVPEPGTLALLGLGLAGLGLSRRRTA